MEREILEKYRLASDKAVNFLESRLTDDGSYGAEIKDLACYYKSPFLFYISGKTEPANRILNYIKTRFMRSHGDFTTEGDTKSENGAFVEYWAYTNCWVAIAAQKMGRFDISYPAYQYLNSFYHPQLGGFTTNKPYTPEKNVIDALTAAHLGLAALYFGDLEKAKSAGNLLQKLIDIQPELESGFYLRTNDEGELLTQFPEEMALFYRVSATQPQQAYFMIGYPPAFLGYLYRATGDDVYLNAAQKYVVFANNCNPSIRQFYLSHKVAWGSAVVANLIEDAKAAEISKSIADYLLTIQEEDGSWLKGEPPHTSFDQTAEIAIWLREISAELSN